MTDDPTPRSRRQRAAAAISQATPIAGQVIGVASLTWGIARLFGGTIVMIVLGAALLAVSTLAEMKGGT